MAEGSDQVREIDLGDDFGGVVVRVNGATIEVAADSHVIVSTRGGVELRPANDSAEKSKTAPEIGDEVEDGTIYAGISPDTHKPLYVTPNDVAWTLTFNEAAEYAKNLDTHGHHDWRVPSKGELNVLWGNRNKGKLEGTFNAAGWYWSSSSHSNTYGWPQDFNNGEQALSYKYCSVNLRCVR